MQATNEQLKKTVDISWLTIMKEFQFILMLVSFTNDFNFVCSVTAKYNFILFLPN